MLDPRRFQSRAAVTLPMVDIQGRKSCSRDAEISLLPSTLTAGCEALGEVRRTGMAG